MTYKIGQYNLAVYQDPVREGDKYYYLVVIDKFSKQNEHIGHKYFYFTYIPTSGEFTEENLDTLWDFPAATRITGQRIIWTTQE